MNRSVAVIGGGISGLTAAFWLSRSGVDVTVLEAAPHTGGTMRTVETDGWLVETGPNSALETTPLFGQMFDALGITGERAYADASSNKRYVLRAGTLHPIPMSPRAFLSTRLWTPGAKLRLLKEPLVGRGTGEESIADFVRRRLGDEFLDYAINPFVAGVFAGNPEQLSVRHAFPKLYALEEKYGGLIKGMIRGARERKQRAETAKDRAKMFSFRRGMQTFPDAIARSLGSRVRTSSPVTRISVDPGRRPSGSGTAESPGEFVLTTPSGEVRAASVVLATPALAAAALLESLDRDAARVIRGIQYPPVAEVFLGFRRDQIGRELDGFGFLIPAVERRQILGTIWSSALFQGRAPEGHVALTTFVGGSRQPALASRSDDELADLVVSELRDLMGVAGSPVFTRVAKWERAIPQYTMGYQTVVNAIEALERDRPGLFVCSNYRGGIAVGDCVMSGERIAKRITEYLGRAGRA
jgi:oxygen-dependent protoporphyrinogen oxidase